MKEPALFLKAIYDGFNHSCKGWCTCTWSNPHGSSSQVRQNSCPSSASQLHCCLQHALLSLSPLCICQVRLIAIRFSFLLPRLEEQSQVCLWGTRVAHCKETVFLVLWKSLFSNVWSGKNAHDLPLTLLSWESTGIISLANLCCCTFAFYLYSVFQRSNETCHRGT